MNQTLRGAAVAAAHSRGEQRRRSPPRRGLRGWLGQRMDIVLGLLLVAAWSAVAVDVDRSMGAVSAAATAPAAGLGGATRAETGTAAPPDHGPASNADAPSRS